MIPMKRATPTLLIAACLPLAGCASIKHAGQKSAEMVRNTSSATASKISSFSLANLIPGNGIKVVKVREKDLRELPTGKEKALAFQNSRKSRFWIFGGPVDFKEPTLPEAGSEMDGSLLPPKVQ